jgi:exopolyphosphatase/guanosine-5'-triphosphate,3'-diphosphate pyrophosphatase
MESKTSRLVASVDIGTNSVLLLVAEYKRTNGVSFRPVREEQQIPRLGKGVDARKTLAKDSYLVLIASQKKFEVSQKMVWPLFVLNSHFVPHEEWSK